MHDMTIDEYQTPASIPLYLSALVITLCGLVAVNLLLEDAAFMNLTMGLTTIGFLVSYVSRRMRIAPRTVELPAVVICAMLTLLAVLSDQMISLLAPPTVGDDRARALAVLLTWLVVFRSFTLLTDGALLFCCVPTIAVMGLVGTMTSDFTLITTFLVFVCASAFMMVHENYLRTRPMEGVAHRARMERILFSSQVQLATLCAVGAILLANIVAAPLRTVGSTLIFSASLTSQNLSSSQRQSGPRPVFSERNDIAVATGPVRLTDALVMRVRADRGLYWRGATFNEYTGRGWRNTIGSEVPLEPTQDPDALFDSGGSFHTYRIPPTSLTRFSGRSQPLRQVITLQGGGLFGEIYGASEMRTIQTTLPLDATWDPTGSVHLRSPIQSTQYAVTSEVPDWSPESLRALRAAYPEEITRLYLQLPPTSAVERLRETARQVTAGMRNAYDKVVALEAWVAQQCDYNLAAAAAPANVDVSEHFLFTSREGYCDSFATSLAVLCRAIDIPARVASGFQTGELNQFSQEYDVRDRDKHLWTEVYFPTVGWIAFDATRDADDITDSASASQRDRNSTFLGFLFRRGWLPPMALLLFLCMLGYVLKVEVWDRLRARRSTVNPLGLPETNLAVVEAYEAASRLLARRGLARPASVTPWEHLAALERRLAGWPEALAAVERLTRLVVRFRYSREVATDEDVRLAQEAVLTLQTVLRSIHRKALLATAEG